MSKKEDSVLTGNSDGWQPLKGVDLELGETQCLHCSATATELVECNRNAYWALCGDCAHESHCESMEAAARSEYEMDYFSGWD